MTTQAKRFGSWMRARRLELRLSQGEAADKAGIDRPTWSDYERAVAPERRPTARTLFGIADALSTPAEDVFRRAGETLPGIEPLAAVPPAVPTGEDAMSRLADAIFELIEEMRIMRGGG